MSIQDAFAHIGEALQKLGADEATLLGLKEKVDAIPAPVADENDLTAALARIEALESEVTTLTNEVASLTPPAPPSDPGAPAAPTFALESDLAALVERVGVIETGIEALDADLLSSAASGAPAVVTITPAILPTAPALGEPFAATLSASGGAGPYQFSIASGAFPAGLSMAAGGAITGTPTMAGAWDVIVQAHDQNGVVGAQEFSGTI